MKEKKKYKIMPPYKRKVLQPSGDFEDVFEVTFVTKEGVRDTVEFSEEDYTPEHIEPILDAKRENHRKIMDLG